MFDPGFDFFIDAAGYGGQSCLLATRTGSDLLGSEKSLIQYDVAPLRLYFRTRSAVAGGVSAAEQLGAGSLVLAGKHIDSLGEASLLFSAVGLVAAGEGDSLHYLGSLDLTDPSIATKMATANTLSARVDVEWTSADGTKRLTWQFDVTIRRQVYNGEANAGSGTPPTYPSSVIHQLFVPREEDAARWRFRDGCWEAYFAEDDAWRPIVGKLVDGVPSFVPGDPVEE
jgi:hypothetical protein